MIWNTDMLLALAGFAFVTSISPGPNNLMLMASGANFGLRRSLPHCLGVALGFVVMLVLVGLGLAGVFDAVPGSEAVLRGLSLGYLLYLAWRIATAAAPCESGAARPLSFLQAAAFQWVNPKAWAMALTAVSVYAPSRTLESVLGVAVLFGLVNLPSVGSWTVLGTRLRPFLGHRRRLRLFNAAMAILLLASAVPVVLV